MPDTGDQITTGLKIAHLINHPHLWRKWRRVKRRDFSSTCSGESSLCGDVGDWYKLKGKSAHLYPHHGASAAVIRSKGLSSNSVIKFYYM